MKAGLPERWKDLLARRELTPAELESLRSAAGADEPAVWAEVEAEQALNGALDRLPDAPMPREFTQRVLQAVEASPTAWLDWEAWLRWLSPVRLAGAAGVLLLLAAALWQYRAGMRLQMAGSLADVAGPVSVVAQAVELPPIEILKDFDAIDRLRRSTLQADLELLASLDPGGVVP